jgi:hypothetical protein
MPAFFLGWIGVGVLVGLGLGRRGHDRRLMTALGVGLGPLMLMVGSEALRREREAVPLVLSPGADHGGDLDVLVLVQHDPNHVRSLAPMLEAVEPGPSRTNGLREIQTTLARTRSWRLPLRR